MDTTERLTRKQLYELIWKEPIFRLSKKYGFSDVGFAKICKKHNIPRPPLGYWARVAVGQKIPKTPLPYQKDNPIIEIHVRTGQSTVQKERDPFIQEASLSKLPKKIIVPEVMIEPHPLVLQAAEILQSCKADNAGMLTSHKKRCFDIQVSAVSVPRALRIMDSVIKALSNMGHDVSITKDGTAVTVLDVVVYIKMKEELIHRRLKAKDHNLDKGYYEFGYKLFEEACVPSGRLILEIIEPTHSWKREYYQLQWRDTDATPLEDNLRRFTLGLIRIAAARKAKQTREQASGNQGSETSHG